MIYTVTLNPSIDYVAVTEEFQTGGINRTAEEAYFPGGKGINVSVVLHNLGCASTALGFTAGFSGSWIEGMLLEKNIHTDFIKLTEGNNRINVKIKSAEETEINGRGPVIAGKDMLKLKEKMHTLLQSGDYLVLSGSAPKGLDSFVYAELIKELPKGVRVAADTEKDLLLPLLREKPFLIKPNRSELEGIFDAEIKTSEEIIYYGKRLQEMGARNVLVSLAEEGAVLIQETGKVTKQAAPKGKVRNSVGAGDSMLAGFLSVISREENYEKAFLTGIAAGSASAFSVGLAERKEVEAMLEICYNFS